MFDTVEEVMQELIEAYKAMPRSWLWRLFHYEETKRAFSRLIYADRMGSQLIEHGAITDEQRLWLIPMVRSADILLNRLNRNHKYE